MDELVIPSPADFHTHLRQNELMKLVTPHVKQGGMHLAYVMVLSLIPRSMPRSFLLCLSPTSLLQSQR